jgi:3-deoxy-D-manno-octulosonic-acid transferase
LGTAVAGKYNRRVYFAYSVLLTLALVLSAPWWLLEMLRHGKYRAGLGERLGAVPERLKGRHLRDTIWIHAVSVGEVLAVSRVVEELRVRQPEWRVVISTTTDTGQKLARERFGESNVFYFPLDLGWATRPYLRALRPKLIVLVESEFWPNLLHMARRASVPVAVVNARVSDRSLPRYVRFRGLLRRVLRDISDFLAQSDEDARRLIQIGAPPERVSVGGNLKFEVKAPARTAIADAFAAAVARDPFGPVIVAGSTLEGEEAILLECFRHVLDSYPTAVLVLAPRHPQRFDAVAALLEGSGVGWDRRSSWSGPTLAAGRVLLLDTIGELAGLYQYADIAFVGGSLVPRGGHNVLEAAQFGVPILVGPYTENFRDIISIFQRAGGLRVVTPGSLGSTMLALFANHDERTRLGRSARNVMQEQGGATQRTVDALLALLPSAVMAEKRA